MFTPSYTVAELATLLEIHCVGDSEKRITGLATLASASDGQVSFLANPKYQHDLKNTRASAVIVSPDMIDNCPVTSLVSEQPYLSYAKASQLFDRQSSQLGGSIHPSAVISASANIAEDAVVSANAVIGDSVVVGSGTTIGPGSVIDEGSVLGNNCLVHANVSIYHGVVIGDRVNIHSGVVIGGDGFGFAPSPDRARGGWVKIAQLGGVQIGDDVEIGAATTIDRGALDDTIIGDRVILDNQVQIAHNVVLGDNTAIAGCTAIAGSTRIGKNCTIAGAVGIIGHLVISDNVHITVRSLITKSIDKPGSYSSGTPMQDTGSWKKNAIRFMQLDNIAKRLAKVEKNLKE